MAALQLTRQAPLRLPAFLDRLAGRFVSRRHTPRSSEERPATRPALDLGDFAVAQLVHDLRIELAIMMGCSENLALVVPKGPSDETIALLRERGKRATLLVLDLLLAASPRPARRGPIDLNDVVARVADALSAMMRGHIQVRLRLSPEPVPVVAEVAELERILLNLALNALDAMTVGGTLTMVTAIVNLSDGDPCGPLARLRVTDTGIGIDPEQRARVVEPFFSTKATGAGLGLSSVAFTVRQLYGTMFIDSVPRRGTTVTVNLPMPDSSPRPPR